MIERLPVVRPLREPDGVRHVADVDADFELGEAESVGVEALSRPGVSVYALDLARGGVAFVEGPAQPRAMPSPLLDAPFLHQAQRNHATHVLRVPFDLFHALAGRAPPPPAPPILVHSTGRCGSTLVSEMLAALPGVASLAEPDLFTGVEVAVADGRLSSGDAVPILESALALATHGLAPADARPAIKFRSEVAWIARELDRACPDARVVFMYRDARRVIESYLRVLGRGPTWSTRLAHVPVLDRVVAARHARRVERRGPRMERFDYVLRGTTAMDVEKRGRWGKFLLQWLAKVHAYLDLRRHRDGDAFALRYEDLVARPEPVLRALFEHCDLPADALADAVARMGRDSQRGTAFHRGAGHAWTLTPRDEREIARVFTDHTELPGPDAVLPGTPGAVSA